MEEVEAVEAVEAVFIIKVEARKVKPLPQNKTKLT